MQANDKHLDLLDDANLQNMTSQLHNTTNLPFTTNNQNSFKSQTLQFPKSSQLGADFINLFADWAELVFINEVINEWIKL